MSPVRHVVSTADGKVVQVVFPPPSQMSIITLSVLRNDLRHRRGRGVKIAGKLPIGEDRGHAS